jgi:hypothetical protein
MNPLDDLRGVWASAENEAAASKLFTRHLAKQQATARAAKLDGFVDKDIADRFSNDTEALLAQLIRELSPFRKVMGLDTDKP